MQRQMIHLFLLVNWKGFGNNLVEGCFKVMNYYSC
jgi:hypothetical protein